MNKLFVLLVLSSLIYSIYSCRKKIEKAAGPSQEEVTSYKNCEVYGANLEWDAHSNPDLDLDGTKIYRSSSKDGDYTLVKTINDPLVLLSKVSDLDINLNPCESNWIAISGYYLESSAKADDPLSEKVCWGDLNGKCPGGSHIASGIASSLKIESTTSTLALAKKNKVEAKEINHTNEVNKLTSILSQRPVLKKALFVLNETKEILTFPFPNEKDLSESIIKISNPQNEKLLRTAYDTQRDILYFSFYNENAILVLTDVSNPNQASRTRLIKGNKTGLNRPIGLAIDSENDILYVANNGSSSITIYNQASMRMGDIEASRTVKGLTTWITAPSGIAIDLDRDTLYLSCDNVTGNDAILTFYPASSIDGEVTASAVLYGIPTKIKDPLDISFDTLNKQLYVLNSNDRVLVFNEMAGKLYNPNSPLRLNGTKRPNRQISGFNLDFVTNQFGGILVDPEKDQLYVSGKAQIENSAVILNFNSASTLSGTVEPAQEINPSNTIISASGMTIDSTGNKLHAIATNAMGRTHIMTIDFTEADSPPIVSLLQLTAFNEDLAGLSFDPLSEKLYAVSDRFMAFSKETLENSLNFFIADQVLQGTDKSFTDLSKMTFDFKNNILYAFSNTGNEIVAFDNFSNQTSPLVSLANDRTIKPNLDNHLIKDFTINKQSDTLYVLMAPKSQEDRKLKVLVFNHTKNLNGTIDPIKILKLSDIPQTSSPADSFCIELDPDKNRLFVSVPRSIYIYDITDPALNGEIKKYNSLKNTHDSKIGLATDLFFYKPDETEENTKTYLIVTLKKYMGFPAGILFFGDDTLQKPPEGESGRGIMPSRSITFDNENITNPLSIAVGLYIH